ncbi:hypothetical protein ACHAXT_008595 [Thalassiosira profunda]
MATQRRRPSSDAEDDGASSEGASSYSESSYSQSLSASSQRDGDDSSFSGTSASQSSGYSDAISRMLTQLEDSDDSLTEVTIDCKTLDKEAAIYVETFLPTNTCLEKLRLRCGDRSSHRQVFRRVVSGMKDSNSIKCVEISELETTREAAELLAPSFAHSKVSRIQMKDCNFVGSAVAMLFVALQHNKHIRHLDFHSCRWEGHNVDIVASSLQFLSLNSLSLVDVNVPMDGWPFLFRHMEECKEMIDLNLSRCPMDDNAVRLLATSIKAQKAISKLSLSACGLADKCLKELARGLRSYTTLTSLDLSNNERIAGDRDKGLIYLKDLVKFNKSLNQLNVKGCGLSEKSMEAIESGLRYNNSLLKSFFSESTSQAIFGVVDSLEQLDMEDIKQSARSVVEGAVSFDSPGSGRKKAADTSRRRRPRSQAAPPMPNSGSRKSAAGQKTASSKGSGKKPRSPGQRRMLL